LSTIHLLQAQIAQSLHIHTVSKMDETGNSLQDTNDETLHDQMRVFFDTDEWFEEPRILGKKSTS